ncbi:hypothetical protein M3Y98_00065100 [Aphelenchoides besseyi]|nr:hypothetical protein M3Y98_00065100 [Aphelenchoides besseyi]
MLGTKSKTVWSEYSQCNVIALNSTSIANNQWTQIDDRKELINILLVDIEGLEIDQYASLIQLEHQLSPLCQIDIRIRNPPVINGQPVNVIDVVAGFLTTDSYSILVVEQRPDLIHLFFFNFVNFECIREFICQ